MFYHGGYNSAETHKYLRAFLILESFTPGYGYAGIKDPVSPRFIAHEIKNLDSFKVSTPDGSPVPLGFPAEGTNIVKRASVAAYHGRAPGGPEGFFHTLMPRDEKAPFHSEPNLKGAEYPFQSSKDRTKWAEFPVDTENFLFYGGEIDINLSWGGVPLQTFKVKFPDSGVTWPFPREDKEFCHYNDDGGFWKAVDDRAVAEQTAVPLLKFVTISTHA